MSTFTAVTDTSQEYGNAINQLRAYRFSALLLLDSQSFGIAGLDVFPRFLIRPNKLHNLLDYSAEPNSVSRGYVSNNMFGGFFVKNTGLTDSELEFEFNYLKMNPPFGFFGRKNYQEFVTATFDAGYQNMLQATWDSITTQEIGTTKHDYLDRFVSTKVVTMNYFDNKRVFLEYDYEGNKTKNVSFS